MKDVTDLRKRAIDLVTQQHSADSGDIPSVRKIVDGLGITNNDFYAAFPGGIPELSRACGRAVPGSRIDQTNRALKARAEDKRRAGESTSTLGMNTDYVVHAPLSAPSSPPRLVLTEEQTRRLYGVSHLEGGKDPLVIMDDLLDYDSKRRREFDLSLSDQAVVFDFLSSARTRGWRDDAELLGIIKKLYYYRIDQLPTKTVFSLVQLAEEAVARRWNIPQFVDEATRSQSIVNWYAQYRRGALSAQSAILNIKALTE